MLTPQPPKLPVFFGVIDKQPVGPQIPAPPTPDAAGPIRHTFARFPVFVLLHCSCSVEQHGGRTVHMQC